MLPHVTKCHIAPIPCHAVLICDMAVHHTNSFEDYELRLPTTFKGSFPSPPLSLSLFSPSPPTVRVRQREGWRGTGKRESLVRRLLLSFLVCLCGQLIFKKVLGIDGAKQIAAYLKSQGVKLEFLVDEGTVIVKDAFPGLKKSYAL